MNNIFIQQPLKTLKKTVKSIRKELQIVLFFLVMLELFLRIVSPIYINNIFDQEYTGGNLINMNSQGNRGEIVHLTKQENELRILAMGDSTTFGTGVASDKTWPALLAKTLNEKTKGIPVTYINSGLPASSPKQLGEYYQQVWSAYQSDYVVIGISNNMIALSWINRDLKPSIPNNPYLQKSSESFVKQTITKLKRIPYYFVTPSWLSINTQRLLYFLGLANHNINSKEPFGPMLAFGWKQADISSQLIQQAWEQFEIDLKKMLESFKKDNLPVIVIYFPSRFTVFDNFYDNEKFVPKHRLIIDPGRKIEEMIKPLDITYINLTETLKNKRENILENKNIFQPLYILFDFTHLDSVGHQAVANIVANKIYQEKLKKDLTSTKKAI